MTEEIEAVDDGEEEYTPYSINLADGNIFVPDIEMLTLSLAEIGIEPLLYQARDGQFYIGHVGVKGKKAVGKWTAFDTICVDHETVNLTIVKKNEIN